MTRHLVVQSAEGERELLLVGTVDVGRDATCTISEADPLLSRRHAEFVVERDEVVVRDLSSRNGIRVNGDQTTEARLEPGDVVQIAGLHIVYRAAEPPPPVAAAKVEALTVSPPIDDDATIVVDKTVVVPPPESGEKQARPDAAAVPAAGPEPPPRPSHAARASWSGRTMLHVVALAAGIIVVTAVPTTIWQRQTAETIGLTTTRAYAAWLGALAGAAIDSGGRVADVADAIAREPGVESALILTPEGRILSPAARANESVSDIPGIGAPSAVFRLRQAQIGGRMEAVIPVRGAGQPRAAIAWVTFRPSSVADVGDAALLLAPAIVLAFGAAVLIGQAIKRRTLGAIALLNEDIELAASGQIAVIEDPLGAPAMADLVRTLNYLVGRVRGGAERQDAAVSQAREDVRAGAANDWLAQEPAAAEARIVTTAGFRISEASAGCLAVLDVRPESLIGKHVIDAFANRRIADALLRCLGAAGVAGEHTSIVEPGDVAGQRLAITVTRTGKDRPVTIIIKAATAVEQV